MPTRLIKDSIRSSDSIDALDYFEEVVFYRLIVTCDDYGRFDARPSLLKASIFPLRTDSISNDDVMNAIGKLSDIGMVQLYEVDGKQYLQLCNWSKHQNIRNQKSKFPDPPSEDENKSPEIENNCLQPQTDDNKSPRNPNPNPNPNPVVVVDGCAREGGNNDDLDEFGIPKITQADREFQQVVIACARAGIEVTSANNQRDVDRLIGLYGLPWVFAAIEIAGDKIGEKRSIGMLKGILRKFKEQGGSDADLAARSPNNTGPPGNIIPMSPEEKQKIEEAMRNGRRHANNSS